MTYVHLERLVYLRDVVWPHVERMAQAGRVDFDIFSSDCGTFQCLAGWAACDPDFVRQGLHLIGGLHVRPAYQDRLDLDAVALFFGLDNGEVQCLFGPNYHGDLAKRRVFLDCIIESRIDRGH